MQALAAEMNLSETSFVLPPDDPGNTARVRIFNRTGEMPFAGHPNVGTGFALATLKPDLPAIMRFEELAGLVEVRIEKDAEILGALLPSLTKDDEAKFEVVQGVEMGRRSELSVRSWREGQAIRASVAGGCRMMFSGRVGL